MVTKKIVEKPTETATKDTPENTQLAEWLNKTRGERSQKEFYENICVEQQTGSNYEKGKTPIPAWVAIRAMKRYGGKEDLVWWTNLTLETPMPLSERQKEVATAAQLLSADQFEQWAAGSDSYKRLTPERAQKLQEFIGVSVELFARGLTEAENHLINQVRVINDLATKNLSLAQQPGASQPTRTEPSSGGDKKSR